MSSAGATPARAYRARLTRWKGVFTTAFALAWLLRLVAWALGWSDRTRSLAQIPVALVLVVSGTAVAGTWLGLRRLPDGP